VSNMSYLKRRLERTLEDGLKVTVIDKIQHYVKDESKASLDYEELARALDILNLRFAAHEIRKIAADETRHRDILQRLLKEVK